MINELSLMISLKKFCLNIKKIKKKPLDLDIHVNESAFTKFLSTLLLTSQITMTRLSKFVRSRYTARKRPQISKTQIQYNSLHNAGKQGYEK